MTLPEWIIQISTLLAVAVLLGVFSQRIRLPLTAVLALIGFLAAWFGSSFVVSPLRDEQFEAVVVFIFLPVLVFEAALSLNTRAFFRNLGSILVLAIPALAVSAACVGFTLYLGLGTPLIAALLFGVLISATDPVAVVAIFRKLGVPRRLLTLVEGESLLNDGVAIVLFNILLFAALGGAIDVGVGIRDFLAVFFGGAAIGAAAGFAAILLLPWLDRLLAAALSIAVAYGSFVVADHVLGFSGVMAALAAGLVLGAFAPSRASAPVRELWHEFWESLGYIANALLFLLIGLSIDPQLILTNLEAIGLAIVAVLVARAVAVVPLVFLLERVAGIPRVGKRNEAVLIWGGLRGGVALALALALPEELPERDRFIAMTGGVVLATLLINATTIAWLVRKLGLDKPSRADQFLACGARISGVHAAQQRLAELRLQDPVVEVELDAAEQSARRELERIELSDAEEVQVVIRRGLSVERETYQHLSDAGLVPPAATRLLLHEVDDHIEEVSLDRVSLETFRRRKVPLFDRILEKLLGWLPQPIGEDPTQVAYAEASARRLAAKRTGKALDLFKSLPNIKPMAVEDAKRTFAQWEEKAVHALAELDNKVVQDRHNLRRRQAEALSRVTSADALKEMAEVGLLPETLAENAARTVVEKVADAVSK